MQQKKRIENCFKKKDTSFKDTEKAEGNDESTKWIMMKVWDSVKSSGKHTFLKSGF